MRQAPTPGNEQRRIAELYAYGLLDTASDEAFDRITRTVCEVLQVPISTVTLVDRERQWFKSAKGLSSCEMARSSSFCGHVVYHDEPLIIDDTLRDERFHDNPLVTGAPYLRFYAGAPLRGANGLAIGVVCAQGPEPRQLASEELAFLRDMAGLCESVAQLRRLEGVVERERRLFADSETVILRWGCEPGWPVQYASENVGEVLGEPSADLIGVPFLDRVHPEDRPRLEQELASAADQGRARYEHDPYRFQRADSSFRWVADVRLIERDAQGAVAACYGYIRDISEEIELRSQLEWRRFYDPQTGLPNRALFERQLEQCLKRRAPAQAPIVVMALDLRDFRAVNNSLGHAVGDEVLTAVGKRLQGFLGEEATVARLSGDEFGVIVSPSGDTEGIVALAEAIADTLEAHYPVEGLGVLLNVRMGIAVCEEKGCTARGLLEQADAAMYEAKSEDARYRFFSNEVTERARWHLQLAGELRAALQRGEVAAHFQSQWDLRTGECVGLEALARWHHPERGWISPGAFIPAAERAGLIGWLGRTILEQACIRGRAWLDQGLAFSRVAINVAAPQLYDEGFVDEVLETLDRTGLPAERLELEITESLMVSTDGAIVARIEALRRKGISVAVDDFGTGYSALSYLRDLPIDRLKIDRSFVDSMAEEERNLAITRAIVALGRSLGLEVIAEGIETEQQCDMLLQEGCEQGQGFLLARPASPETMCDRLSPR